jgi:hypothetical protein
LPAASFAQGEIMSDELAPPEDPDAGAEAARPSIRLVTPLADELEDDDVGGDSVCWAHLVCEECGAITTEGHRDGCSLSR